MKVVWHKGTGTWMALDDCTIIDVPDSVVVTMDAEAIEEWLRENA